MFYNYNLNPAASTKRKKGDPKGSPLLHLVELVKD